MGRIRSRKVLPGGRTPYSGEEAYQHLQREYEARAFTSTMEERIAALTPTEIGNGGEVITGPTAWTDRHLGSNSGITSYYIAGTGAGSGATRTTYSPATGFLVALPVYCPSYSTVIDSISIHITAGALAGRLARVGIYRNTASGNLYPGDLAGSVELDLTTTGTKEAAVEVECAPGELLWAAFTTNNSTPTWNAVTRSSISQAMLGFEDRSVTTASAAGHYVSFVFAALPDPFPSYTGRTALTSDFPSVYLHFSEP